METETIKPKKNLIKMYIYKNKFISEIILQ